MIKSNNLNGKIANFIINFYIGFCRKNNLQIYNNKISPHDICSLILLEENGYINRYQTKNILKEIINEY